MRAGDARQAVARYVSPSLVRTRLLMLVLLALLPVLGLLLYHAFEKRSAAASEAKGKALALAQATALTQERLVEEAHHLLIALARVPDVRGGDRDRCARFLAGLLPQFPRYANLGVIAPDGELVCSALPPPGRVNVADRAYFRRALETRDFAVGDYQIGRVTRKASVNFGFPIVDDAGAVRTVVFAALDLAWLSESAAEVQLPRGTTLSVLDAGGTVLARYPDPERWIGQVLPEAPIVKAILAEREGVAEARGLDGVARFYGFTSLPGSPESQEVFLAIGIPKGAALASARAQLTRDLVVLGLVGAFVLATARAIARAFLLRPIEALGQASRRLSTGDLRARTGPLRGPRELRELARTFDTMADSLERRDDELRKLNEELEQRVIQRTEQLEARNVELEARRVDLERALEQLAEEKERVDAFYRFAERIASEAELEPLAGTILTELCEFAEAEIGALYVVDQEYGDTPRLVSARGVEPKRLPAELQVGEELAGRALAEAAANHELDIPLEVGEAVIGMIMLGRTVGPPFREPELQVIEHLARQAAVALSNGLSLRHTRHLVDINRAVLDATPAGIALVDLAGKTLLRNAALRQLLEEIRELPREGALYERAGAIAELTTDPAHYLALMDELAADPEREMDYELELADSRRCLHVHTTPVRDGSGFPVGRVFAVRDVTAEREAERLKNELVATVSHELRTPLASILGFAELLLARDREAATRERFVETIHSEAKRLSALINDFLDLQRIEAGRFELAVEPFQLGEVLGEAVELFSAQSDVHELLLDLPAEPPVVWGERDQIIRVAGNLLSNAIKYSPGGGRIEVSAEPLEGAVRVSVKDSGLGIPADQQQRIFSKFFRVDSPERRSIGGTGLGLALCREIVQAHRGRIGFESVEGEGSTFWFELPAAQRRDESSQRRVLAGEDDPAAAALSECLEEDGRAEGEPRDGTHSRRRLHRRRGPRQDRRTRGCGPPHQAVLAATPAPDPLAHRPKARWLGARRRRRGERPSAHRRSGTIDPRGAREPEEAARASARAASFRWVSGQSPLRPRAPVRRPFPRVPSSAERRPTTSPIWRPEWCRFRGGPRELRAERPGGRPARRGWDGSEPPLR